MRIIFKTIRGHKRWFLLDENGEKLAKFYSQPTREAWDTLSALGVAFLRYRGRVNARCDAKRRTRVYRDD